MAEPVINFKKSFENGFEILLLILYIGEIRISEIWLNPYLKTAIY